MQGSKATPLFFLWALSSILMANNPTIPKLVQLQQIIPGEALGPPVWITLPNRVEALTVLLRERLRVEVNPRQQIRLQSDEAFAQTKNSEEWKTIENHVQLWLVPLERFPLVDSALKSLISPCTLGHQRVREMAFLGKGHGFAWFIHAPNEQWVYLSELLELSGGDDPIDAAIAHNSIEFLIRSMPKAFLQITQALQQGIISDKFDLIINTMRNANDEAVIHWLVDHADGSDPEVSGAARYCLVEMKRSQFLPLYQQWLLEEIDHTLIHSQLSDLLRVCHELHLPGLLEVVQKVINRPTNLMEYRQAFQLDRELRGKPLANPILKAERTIQYSGHRSQVNQAAIDQAVEFILTQADPSDAAVIGVSLAVYFTAKANWNDFESIHAAGVQILRRLPADQGLALVAQLQRTCPGCKQEHLSEIAKMLASGSNRNQ